MIFTNGGMMMSIDRHEKNNLIRTIFYGIIISSLFVLILINTSHAARTRQMTFLSSEKAFSTMVSAIESGDVEQLTAVFGMDEKNLLPADKDENARKRERFVKAYHEKNRLEYLGTNKIILHVGNNDWPWPVPLVKTNDRWHFDTRTGIEEITARRIGKNEISAVQVCLAYVDSQLEYARMHTKNGISEYAQKFASSPDQKDGLCWDSKDGEIESPVGRLLASACDTGAVNEMKPEPPPYHGYLYRILKKQGKNATGGAYDYVVDGKMIGGFALIAFPAVYGSTGITTFIVNKDDVVYQKDLGTDTARIARSIMSYDPDPTWEKTE
jgi:hypothetical protein